MSEFGRIQKIRQVHLILHGAEKRRLRLKNKQENGETK